MSPNRAAAVRPATQHDAEQLLTALRLTVGDQADELLPELSGLFQDEGPRLLNAIRKAITDTDHQQLAAAAHTLKSSSASLGSQELPGLCQKLEALGRSGTVSGGASQIIPLNEGYARFTAILDLACAILPTPNDVHPRLLAVEAT